MKVEVRPIDNKKWHGKKGKESFAQPKAVEALYDERTGALATGLSKEDSNGATAAGFGVKRLSILMPGVDLTDTFNPNEPHPFWSTKAATVMLLNNTMIFDTDKPIDEIKVKLMKANKMVANSQKELDEGKWPDATHIIFDEEEDVEIKASKIELEEEAIEIAAKMSLDDRIAMVQILSNRSIKGRSPSFVRVELRSVIEADPLTFLKYAKMGREEVHVRASVLELIQKGILNKENQSVYYMGELVGIDYEAAVEWFKNPQNSKMKVMILEKNNA